jgi:hypothetical protein
MGEIDVEYNCKYIELVVFPISFLCQIQLKSYLWESENIIK